MKIFETLAQLEQRGTPAALCTVVEAQGSAPQVPGAMMVVQQDGSITGTVGGGSLEHEVIARAKQAISDNELRLHAFNLKQDLGMACGGALSVFIEPLFRNPDLIIFGAGHIGRDLCVMASRAGFRVTVVDGRPQWADDDHFPDAHAVVAADPIESLDDLPFGPESYAVLVSHSHQVDHDIIKHAIRKPWRYMGMIGSKRKVKHVYGKLTAAGVDASLLERVHSPIGLKIGGNDPGEIAVSILAELIRVRYDKAEDPGTSFWPAKTSDD